MAAFVIEFNRHTQVRRVTEFSPPRAAMERRIVLEGERADPNVEIVALVGKSLDTLTRTHSRYFVGNETPKQPAPA